MKEPETFFQLIHTMWDAFGFMLLAAIIAGAILANFMAAGEYIMKKKNKAVKDKIQNDKN